MPLAIPLGFLLARATCSRWSFKARAISRMVTELKNYSISKKIRGNARTSPVLRNNIPCCSSFNPFSANYGCGSNTMSRSIVYSHIYLYRMAMNVLYGGKYHRRFTNIVDSVGSGVSSVCDLCFGDLVIAEWCRFHSIRWVGVDLNHHFCERARKRGFDVLEGDIFSLQLPDADVFVIAGSLYHFQARLGDFFDLVLSHTDRVLLS